MGNDMCECLDCQCGACAGRCAAESDVVLYRIDMVDYTGTAFCEGCAEDALDSAFFTSEPPDTRDYDDDDDQAFA